MQLISKLFFIAHWNAGDHSFSFRGLGLCCYLGLAEPNLYPSTLQIFEGSKGIQDEANETRKNTDSGRNSGWITTTKFWLYHKKSFNTFSVLGALMYTIALPALIAATQLNEGAHFCLHQMQGKLVISLLK
ncbi:hypothetical protein ACH5RR_041814 [Cinchona calisaya]|uniref:Uncharacterized protein n=1 Tax=Cinchona calisaya TaxID=153742 RepID=A0ABD2XZV8_9GENT